MDPDVLAPTIDLSTDYGNAIIWENDGLYGPFDAAGCGVYIECVKAALLPSLQLNDSRIDVGLSTDADNIMIVGSDGGLQVPSVGGEGTPGAWVRWTTVPSGWAGGNTQHRKYPNGIVELSLDLQAPLTGTHTSPVVVQTLGAGYAPTGVAPLLLPVGEWVNYTYSGTAYDSWLEAVLEVHADGRVVYQSFDIETTPPSTINNRRVGSCAWWDAR